MIKIHSLEMKLRIAAYVFLLLAGILQVFLGEFYVNVSAKKHLMPMIYDLKIEDEKIPILLAYLREMSKPWKLVAFSGWLCSVLSLMLLYFNRVSKSTHLNGAGDDSCNPNTKRYR